MEYGAQTGADLSVEFLKECATLQNFTKASLTTSPETSTQTSPKT